MFTSMYVVYGQVSLEFWTCPYHRYGITQCRHAEHGFVSIPFVSLHRVLPEISSSSGAWDSAKNRLICFHNTIASDCDPLKHVDSA